MPPLSQVQSMKAQGMPDASIIQTLQEQGYSPLEINQAIEQAKIKEAVTKPNADIAGMQSSVINQEFPSPEQQASQPAPEQAYYPQPGQAYPQQQYQQDYSQQYQPYQGQSSDTYAEIAEQIADEKIMALKRSLGNVEELKSLVSKKVENIDARLKKVEELIDSLQQAILGKVMSYGENIEQIKDEMSMMQQSFSKVINPLLDKQQRQGEKPQQKEQRQRKSDGFENYLR